MTEGDFAARFSASFYPTPASVRANAAMIQAAGSFAAQIILHVPEGREQALVLTKIEEAIMWAHAGIARHLGEVTSAGVGSESTQP